jgi:hypothetical protein
MRCIAVLAALSLLAAPATRAAGGAEDGRTALDALEEAQRNLEDISTDPESTKYPPGAWRRGVLPDEAPLASPRHIDRRMGWSIIPPAGFSLVQTGKKTIWRRGDLEVLVETEASPRGTAIGDWVELSRRYERAYGRRYELVQIGGAALAGYPGAVWEFIKDDRHKVDVATHVGDVGYAVMVSGPARRFERDRELLEKAIGTFRVVDLSASALKRP